jgi:flavin reductase (DIM6/NTAB) family NADH-FMN oxidoreductase RutF
MKIIPGEVKTGYLHGLMLGAIAPRPIAFVSTVDREGRPNLSPFSFFNAFGSKPPTVAFSPARRVRNNTTKHTLENARQTREAVINVVTYDIVQQASLSSCEYPRDVNEFVKAGLTPLPSEAVKPPRVKESPVQMECVVRQIVETGQEGGAANLVICEILVMHIADEVLNEEQKIDPEKLRLVGRMGGDYYSKAYGAALFKVAKPSRHLGIGFDRLPVDVLKSEVLTGNELATLANLDSEPGAEAIRDYLARPEVKNVTAAIGSGTPDARLALHLAAKKLIASGRPDEAFMLLLGAP